MSTVASMLGRASTDSNPDMKQKVATFAGTLCREHNNTAGIQMKSVVVGLTANLAHQHSKVRKITLKGLKDILVARGAEDFIADAVA